MGDHGISLLAKALAIRDGSILDLNLQRNKITSTGVRALVDENVEAEVKFLGQQNRFFTPLLKASHPPDASPQVGIWSRALAKVATEPDVLFHVLRNKPKLVGSAAGGSKKRKRNDE